MVVAKIVDDGELDSKGAFRSVAAGAIEHGFTPELSGFIA